MHSAFARHTTRSTRSDAYQKENPRNKEATAEEATVTRDNTIEPASSTKSFKSGRRGTPAKKTESVSQPPGEQPETK